MPYSNTFTGKRFYYDGELNTGLKVYPLDDENNKTGTIVRIDAETILFVKKVINEKGKIKMGACRDKPSPQSLGEMISKRGKSPQWLSYMLPLLEEEDFLHITKRGAVFGSKELRTEPVECRTKKGSVVLLKKPRTPKELEQYF